MRRLLLRAAVGLVVWKVAVRVAGDELRGRWTPMSHSGFEMEAERWGWGDLWGAQVAKKKREDIGVELYGVQQQLAKIQLTLERTHDNYNLIRTIREQVRAGGRRRRLGWRESLRWCEHGHIQLGLVRGSGGGRWRGGCTCEVQRAVCVTAGTALQLNRRAVSAGFQH